eukprot:jgi/Chrzof1/2219/Cz11g07050.t1
MQAQQLAFVVSLLKNELGQKVRRLASLVMGRLAKVAGFKQPVQPGGLLKALQATPRLVADLEPMLGDMTALAQDMEEVYKELTD